MCLKRKKLALLSGISGELALVSRNNSHYGSFSRFILSLNT